MKHIRLSKDRKRLVGLAVVLASLPIAVYLVSYVTTKLRSRAQVAGVNLSIRAYPGGSVLRSGDRVAVFLNPNSQRVVFARVVVVFDKNKIQVTGPVSTNQQFDTSVVAPDLTSANQTGRLTIIYAVGPGKTPVTVSADFVSFGVDVISRTSNDSTSISLQDLQVVSENSTVLTPTLTSATFVLNPSISPTASIPTPTLTLTPTSTRPPSTPTPTAILPTATVTPTVTPSANSAPQITTSTIPPGVVGGRYSTNIRALDANISDNLSMVAYNLPSGFSLGSCSQQVVTGGKQITCVLSGRTNNTMRRTITVVASDGKVQTSKNFVLFIADSP